MTETKTSPKKPGRWAKRLFFLMLTLTLYYFFVWFGLPFFADPRFSQFSEHRRLYNWDLRQHARGDFDGDGQEDLITFTGCAFITSAEEGDIPESRRCTAQGIAPLVFRGQDDKVGQKYIDVDQYNLSLSNRSLVSHSYVAKSENQLWRIYVNDGKSLRAFEIHSDGLLKETTDISTLTKIDETLYIPSRLFILFALPLLPLSFIFTPLFEPFRGIGVQWPIHEMLLLLVITTFFYVVWRVNVQRSNSKDAK